MYMLTKKWTSLGIWLGFAAALVVTNLLDAAPESLRVLMIGNSYTAMTHEDLRAMLAADPQLKVELVAHCPGGKTIAEHAANPKVDQLLKRNGKWNVVILQEQSQLPAFAIEGPAGGPMLRQLDAGAPVLIPRIHQDQPNARIIVFETWARHRDPDLQKTLEAFHNDPLKMQAALTKGYRRMICNPPAWDFSKLVTYAPVGQAFTSWYVAHGYDNLEIKLHRPDNTHPSKSGAFLTASVLYECITGRQATALPYDGGVQGKLDGMRLADALKRHAHATLLAYRKEALPAGGGG